MIDQTMAVALRVLRQISRDRRFVILSLFVPLAVIGMLRIFFAAADNPLFEVNDFVPPVSGFIVHFLTYVLTAIVLVRERAARTLARMFISGYRRGSIIAGYMLAYTLLATLQSLVVLVEVNLLFDLGFAFGTWLAIYGVFWLLSVISLSLGILVSNFARNEGQVFPFIPLVLMPSVFFSGMIVSADNLPGWIAWARFVTPMFYANEIIQAITGDGGFAMLFALLAYGAVVLSLAVFTLREDG